MKSSYCERTGRARSVMARLSAMAGATPSGANNPPRVHDVFGVQRALDGAHERQSHGGLVVLQLLELQAAHAMFGRDRPVELRNGYVHQRVHALLVLLQACR